jgi:hypothetical protein
VSKEAAEIRPLSGQASSGTLWLPPIVKLEDLGAPTQKVGLLRSVLVSQTLLNIMRRKRKIKNIMLTCISIVLTPNEISTISEQLTNYFIGNLWSFNINSNCNRYNRKKRKQQEQVDQIRKRANQLNTHVLPLVHQMIKKLKLSKALLEITTVRESR